jgi:hypothetical protein
MSTVYVPQGGAAWAQFAGDVGRTYYPDTLNKTNSALDRAKRAMGRAEGVAAKLGKILETAWRDAGRDLVGESRAVGLALSFAINRAPAVPNVLPYSCPVRLGASPVQGRGVFAVRDIKPWTIVTFYPCDIVRKGNSDEYSVSRGSEGDTSFRNDYGLTEGTLSCAGDPSRTDDPWFIGHMCNDRVRFTQCPSDPKRTALSMMVYIAASRDGGNVTSAAVPVQGQTAMIAMVSKRHIAAGEELFYSYGTAYWMTH